MDNQSISPFHDNELKDPEAQYPFERPAFAVKIEKVEEKLAQKGILKVKYSYGPYFWMGVCLLIVYYVLMLDIFLWDLLAVFGCVLMLLDRVLCRFKRLRIYEDARDANPLLGEKIELDISVPEKFHLFNRQRGIAFGAAIIGFYSSFIFWHYVLEIEEVFSLAGFYFWGVGATLILYQTEAKDIYRWKKIARNSKGQELMMSTQAVYLSARLIKFGGRVAALKKKYILTTSGHLMIRWSDIHSWMLIRRPLFILGPDFYCHEIRFNDGRSIRIDREHFLDHENEILHIARRHTRVVVEELPSLWAKDN